MARRLAGNIWRTFTIEIMAGSWIVYGIEAQVQAYSSVFIFEDAGGPGSAGIILY